MWEFQSFSPLSFGWKSGSYSTIFITYYLFKVIPDMTVIIKNETHLGSLIYILLMFTAISYEFIGKIGVRKEG